MGLTLVPRPAALPDLLLLLPIARTTAMPGLLMLFPIALMLLPTSPTTLVCGCSLSNLHPLFHGLFFLRSSQIFPVPQADLRWWQQLHPSGLSPVPLFACHLEGFESLHEHVHSLGYVALCQEVE